MAIRSVYAPRRQWPAWLLASSALAAVLVAAAGEPPAVLALAALWVLCNGWLVRLVARADRGAQVRPAVLRLAAGGSTVSGLLLVVLAEQLRRSLPLLGLAVGFLLIVLLLGGWLLLAGISDPPAWLRDAQGRAVPARQRLGFAARHLARLLQQRPFRSPRRILHRTSRDLNRMVWRAGTPQASVLSHFTVVFHPDTLRRLDGWIPVQHVASELAQSYAEAHRALPGRSNHVVVHVAADPAVPIGVAAVAGSFLDPRLQAPVAKAWARLHGLPDERRLDGAYRYPAAAASPQAATGGDADRTQVLAAPDGATMTLIAPRSEPSLRLRPCGPDGVPDPAAAGFELAGRGPWRIGRGAQADVRFAEEHVSRLHAEVVALDGGWGIVDRSSVGTVVNGRTLTRGRVEPIRGGDIVELAPGFPRRVLLRVA